MGIIKFYIGLNRFSLQDLIGLYRYFWKVFERIFGGYLESIWNVLFGNPPFENSKEKRRKNLQKNKKNHGKQGKRIFSVITRNPVGISGPY